MSRFKEGKRIQAAIASGIREELLWAQQYCRGRVDIAVHMSLSKRHFKHWMQFIDKIEAKLEESAPVDDQDKD